MSKERNDIILRMHNDGVNQSKIAQYVDLSQGRVSQIIARVNRGGSFQWGGHRVSQLSSQDTQQLDVILSKGAEAAGFEGEVWTLRRVQQVIEDHFGVHYTIAWVGTLLKKLGYSRQTPRQKDIRQDPEAVSTLRKTRLAELKKSSE